MRLSSSAMLIPLAFLVFGCSDWTIPACRSSYSKRGDARALQDLTEQFQKTVGVVQRENNIFLLSEARNIVSSRNFVAMEEWVCRAQKQYGKP